jgi:hypothetical protein
MDRRSPALSCADLRQADETKALVFRSLAGRGAQFVPNVDGRGAGVGILGALMRRESGGDGEGLAARLSD